MASRRHVSVDFGGSGLRGVEFSADKKGALTIHAVAEVPLAVGTIHGGLVEDTPDLTRGLKALWVEGKFKSKEVVFGVANKNVVVRRVEVDWMEPKVFRQSLRYQIPEGILMEDREYNVDFHVLEEFTATAPDGSLHRKNRILLIAAEVAMLDSFLVAIKDAGLKPVKADHLAFALTRVAALRHANGAELLVDIGSHTTNIVIHNGGQPLFVRTIPGTGGENITDDLVSRFGWTHQVAEESKHLLGVSASLALAHTPSAFGAAPQQVEEQHPAQAVVDKHVADFITEIRNSVDYFLSSHGTVQSVDRVVFSGGGALMTGMAERIASELQIPVEIAQPFRAVGVKNSPVPDSEAARWNTAVGLATGVNR